MKDGFYRQTARVEAVHWWFVHRRRMVTALLRRQAGLASGTRVLDIGCGTGGNLAWLRRAGWDAVGLDVSQLALSLARSTSPEAALVRTRAERLGSVFRPGSFDLATVFNVLYHAWVPDEAAVLGAARTVLAPTGYLLLTEPAFAFLRRRHDEVDHGIRRYTRRSLSRLVEHAGFDVVVSTYFNFVAFAPALLAALVDRARRQAGGREGAEETSEVTVPPAGLNRALIALCGIERAWIGRRWRVPFGVGVLVLARAASRAGGEDRGAAPQVGT